MGDVLSRTKPEPLPALLIFLPHMPVANLLGTNKLASIAGTSLAVPPCGRYVRIEWRATLPATVTAFVFSFIGARIASLINTETMRVVILVLLVLIVISTFVRKDRGTLHARKLAIMGQLLVSVGAGMTIGFYEGFFRPGNGSFLILVFIDFFGFNFLKASASAKLINFATNLSAMLYVAFTNTIVYTLAIPVAPINIFRSLTGTRLAILRGSRFVRLLFLLVVGARSLNWLTTR